MNYTVDCGKPLVDLTMDMSLHVTRLWVLLDGLGAIDVILDQIVWRAD